MANPVPDPPDVSPRDLVILRLRVAHPTASSRELSDRLEAYGISLSHNRVNEILRELSAAGALRTAALPHPGLFRHYLFRVALEYAAAGAARDACRRALAEDPNVLLFASADGRYRWHVLARFVDDASMAAWARALVDDHGALVDELDVTTLYAVTAAGVDASPVDDLLAGSETGRDYLAARADARD